MEYYVMADTAECNVMSFPNKRTWILSTILAVFTGNKIKFTLTNSLTRIVYQTEAELISKFIENFGVNVL